MCQLYFNKTVKIVFLRTMYFKIYRFILKQNKIGVKWALKKHSEDLNKCKTKSIENIYSKDKTIR